MRIVLELSHSSNGKSKLETALYVYMQQRKKLRMKSRNLIAGITQFLIN